jgi:UDP-N-acetylmuramyl pentapeptide phosphotransferase/UDP-N-acetylglucosamine-1-phosphate transferase
MYEVLLSFITAFIPSYFIIPSVIHVAHQKHLFDAIDERRSHVVATPSLGGVAIFAGLMFSMIFWMPFNVFGHLQYTLCAFIIIFLIGVKDDILPITPYKKLLGELMAAGIIVLKSGVKITSLHGFFGITHIPDWFSVLLTIFTIIVIINAFNLIDGINGLSGSIATVISTILGIWFFYVGNNPTTPFDAANTSIGLSIMAFSLAGAIVAFLKYNFTPAKIFMGDTGALLLGLISSILVIQFIEINQSIIGLNPLAVSAGPAVAIGFLILPLFDTARVFAIRMIHGRSPFSPDRLHIHHLLIDFGFSHMQATGILVLVTISFIAFVLLLQNIGTFTLLALILVLAAILSYMLQKIVEKRKAQMSITKAKSVSKVGNTAE